VTLGASIAETISTTESVVGSNKVLAAIIEYNGEISRYSSDQISTYESTQISEFVYPVLNLDDTMVFFNLGH
jgi:chemotaxis signal transduction protein